MRKHFSHTPGHNLLFISTSVAHSLAELRCSYDKKIQGPRDLPLQSVTALQTESLSAPSIVSTASDSINSADWNGETMADNPPEFADMDCGGVTEIIADETEDLNIVVDGMEGLTAIEIREVQEFPLTNLRPFSIDRCF